MVANFRTEESQRRLLTAVIAAHPDLKLNFKDIAHYFGDSTPDGIQWQFRGIKRDAEAMRQGKGGAAGTATNSTPVTPKAGRKRVAASAPSTGKSTASKKARGSSAKAVQPAPVINLDDDDDENEFPPISVNTPIQGPRFTEAYHKQFFGTDAQIPALDTTQADTPNEEEDFKPHTPSDAAAFSFSQAPLSSGLGGGGGGYNLDTYPISQPSFAPSSGFTKTWVGDDFDDDEV